MRHAEHDFGVSVSVSRVNVALNDLVVHQPINYVVSFLFGGAENIAVPFELLLVQKSTSRSSLVFSEVLVRVIGSEPMWGMAKLLHGGFELSWVDRAGGQREEKEEGLSREIQLLEVRRECLGQAGREA